MRQKTVYRNTVRSSVAFLVTVFFAASAFADASGIGTRAVCDLLFKPNRFHSKTSTSIWAELREQHLLINQRSIAGGDAFCGPTCVVNTVQYLRVEQGLPALANPRALLQELAATGATTAIGTPLPRLTAQLRTVLKQFTGSDARQLQITVVQGISDASMKAMPEVREVSRFDDLPLTSAPGEFKYLMSVLMSDSKPIGMHVQILRGLEGIELSLVDPMAPDEDVRLTVAGKIDRINSVDLPRFRYLKNYPGLDKLGDSIVPVAVLTFAKP